ncbi:protein of unknown function DUF2520-containing protein [Emticicia oligotrophica DSM 17448]|uniref:DUF2520 domain-containing protein n=1 Tax=Emticicia oligotrophica (strain DSM 17448 / CIP 109782 / MTCC 6937 / GPTSA100-15) TaxID=929562 RepID=A0ABN4ARH2_EMTOG|nr:Rossmann-like and DUF2520 domain-containing protein [Emticicia oligotrophica]AFK03901.1 protein of unknown function DUF2520-containing protein [Emticicia oligotrophica DSM 17448]
MKISIIGAGNVAWHLAITLEDHHHTICEVFSRTEDKAEKLCSLLYRAEATTDLNFAESEAEFFILAVADDAWEDVCSKLILPEDAILAHTSGTKSLEDLQKLMQIHHDLPVKCAVFYPLMTFTAGKELNFKSVPLCLESDDEDVEQILLEIAQEISQHVYFIDSAERRVLHVAAVFACNFTNHLLALSKTITDSENLDFDLLKPLISETFKKALNANDPVEVQTGPAIRRDKSIINRHLDYLRDDARLLEIYEVLTESIQNT